MSEAAEHILVMHDKWFAGGETLHAYFFSFFFFLLWLKKKLQ